MKNLPAIHKEVIRLSERYQSLAQALKQRIDLQVEISKRVKLESGLSWSVDDEPTGVMGDLRMTLGLKTAPEADRKRYKDLVAKEYEIFGVPLDGNDRLAEELRKTADKLVKTLLPALEAWESDRLALEKDLEEYAKYGDDIKMADAIAKLYVS